VLKRINGADCSQEIAEEILQETYINLMRTVRRGAETPIEDLEKFIFTPLYNACVNFYKKRIG
jgi:DNA-directed RNA polymerase specialized sigma24 family protein